MDEITYTLDEYDYTRLAKNIWTKRYWLAGDHALVKKVPLKDVAQLESIHERAIKS